MKNNSYKLLMKKIELLSPSPTNMIYYMLFLIYGNN